MSIFPGHSHYECPRHHGLVNQRFGMGQIPHEYQNIAAQHQAYGQYYRRLGNTARVSTVSDSTTRQGNEFHRESDLQHFAPEEILVKTVDGHLVIEAKHGEKQDEQGFISRSFTRKYPLPEGVEAGLVTWKLLDGVLSVTVPLKAPPKAANEKVVPIVQTVPVKNQEEPQN